MKNFKREQLFASAVTLLVVIAGMPATAETASAPDSSVILGTTPANSPPGAPVAPDWAYPNSPAHKQVPPPSDFHRAPRIIEGPIGIFEGQADVGAALTPGSASYNDGKYTITSAGYNIWYNRDEFRYLWKKMSGDVSLAADIAYPNPVGPDDRKAVLIFRQSLDDDSKEVMVALHAVGMMHIAERPEKDQNITDRQYRIMGRGLPGADAPDSLVPLHAKRIGIQKKGDEFTLWVSEEGEPIHQISAPVNLHLDEPYYVGIGFVSHLPTTTDTAVLSNVMLENTSGMMR